MRTHCGSLRHVLSLPSFSMSRAVSLPSRRLRLPPRRLRRSLRRGRPADAVAANQATVQKYCVSCHNEKVKSGGLTLTTLDLARAAKDTEAWEHVIRKVRTGAMPPAGRPRPDKAAAGNLVTYLETELDKAALRESEPGPSRAGAPEPRRVSQRDSRCARARDRRHVDAAERRRRLRIRQQRRCADAVADADGAISGSGGEDQSDGARTAARRADAGNLLRADRSQSERARSATICLSDLAAAVALRYYFPADGEYLFEMRPKEGGAGGGFEGITAEPHQLDIAIDNVKVGTTTLGGPEFAATAWWRRWRGGTIRARIEARRSSSC